MTYDQKKHEEIIKDLDNRFKDHRVTARAFVNLMPDDNTRAHLSIEEIHWSIPNDGNFSCTYLFRRNGLVVYGDLGEAVYVWNEPISLSFVAQVGYSYFISKCRGIDGHVDLHEWDPDRVASRMNELFEEMSPEGRAKKEDEFSDWKDSSHNRHEWDLFVQDHESLNHSEAYDWGQGIHFRAMCHWYGLKLAYKQFKESRTPQTAV